MANINTVSCDNCGILKGETNHWWIVEANIKTRSMFIHPFEFGQSHGLDYIRLVSCGLECLSIVESKIKEGVNPLK